MPYLYAVRMLVPNQNPQPIKVGFSTNPNNRMRHYDSGPYPCELVGVWLGTVDDERELHTKYQAIRLTGEWFAPNDALLREITAKIKAHQETAVPRLAVLRDARRTHAMNALEEAFGGLPAA